MKPTVGRVLHYWRNPTHGPNEQPEAAMIRYVHNDALVDIAIFAYGYERRDRIPIGPREGGNYCEWPAKLPEQPAARPTLHLKARN